MYYKRHELQWRMNMFFSASILAGAVSGVSWTITQEVSQANHSRSFLPTQLHTWMEFKDMEHGAGYS
jgi:hypothetical protein